MKLFVEPSDSSATKKALLQQHRRTLAKWRQDMGDEDDEDPSIDDDDESLSGGDVDDEVNDCESGSYWEKINRRDDSDDNSSIASEEKEEGKGV